MKGLILLLVLFLLGPLTGCTALGGGIRVSAQAQPSCPPGSDCTIAVEKGGVIRPYMGYMINKTVTPSGQVFTNVAVNASGSSLVQSTLPAVISAVGGWQAASVHAAAIRFAAKQKGDGINIYNQGGDAVSLQQTAVDGIQGPHDPDVAIEEENFWPPPQE